MDNTEKQKKNNKKRWFRAGSILCGVIFLGALLFIGVYVGRQRQAEREYEAMREAQRIAEAEAAEEQAEAERRRREQEEAKAREAAEKKSDAPHLENTIDFETLQAENSDIYAWIQIPGTMVDYPILQHPTDDSYYLNHTPEGVSGLPGSIYTESVHPKDFSAPLTVIYGHNMRNGSMFGLLRKYFQSQDSLPGRYIWICTPEKNYRYEIFSSHVVDAAGEVYTLFSAPDQQFQQYLDSMKAQSLVDFGVDVTKEDKVITLSTCTGNDATRFVVQAKREGEY